ncbi:Ras-related protein Rab-11A [Nematocida parisii]|uniref:GTPase Ypt3 n=1 Tax=Nematocida parisii (strain ERTm3) TaxID=935791 RepID=I3EEV7_NEMP3|nr:GTPase Ypt3 [Nematocida parisii ERTm1]EIJ87754.1 GTPase Ypt3 [Nematocida parisii ERTm3]KAI5127203.1 Ras-related protein Rab-11A [Nematocida parisii]KAI5165882.1 Ras-related protein Rab-11A [Nematocida sp. AWRm79]KAI5183189.1 Ras-related protein Rab-11A [Nematocida sp. AWRm78]OAG33284.1 Ras-related protein Rab-11A [Nematocida sp. ERTm5]|eukprot:XP_013059763.1 GTPase Ypt3 [Nematocida parisii ERTm1]
MRREEQEYEYLYKIVLIGDSSVGKTNLLERLAHNRFNTNTKSTIGVEFDTKCFVVNGKKIKAQIWDTAGQERYRAITSAYYRGAVGAIVVYDITRKESFDNARTEWIKQLKDNSESGLVISLVGNKTDLEEKRQVSQQEAREAAQIGDYLLTETSALSDVNVQEAFEALIKKIYQTRTAERNNGPKPSIINLEDDSSMKASSSWCC